MDKQYKHNAQDRRLYSILTILYLCQKSLSKKKKWKNGVLHAVATNNSEKVPIPTLGCKMKL